MSSSPSVSVSLSQTQSTSSSSSLSAADSNAKMMNGSIAYPLKNIPLSYDTSNSDQSARDLVVALFPEWDTSPGPVEFVKFKDGITNTLFKAIKKRPGHSDHQIDHEAILLRAYGNGTAVLIDRDREAQSHALLAKNGLAPALLARFNNGLLYRFIEGKACTPDDLQRPDIWPAIAYTLGQWHGTLLPDETTAASGDNQDRQYDAVRQLIPGRSLPHLWSVMQKWINALPSQTDSERARNEKLQEELNSTATEFANTRGLNNGAYVVAHCDLLSGNVIVRPRTAKNQSQGQGCSDVSFIDYEYATPAPAAFDLANHFAEYIGFDCDMSKIPARKRRRAFIREYVISYRKHSKLNGNTNDHKTDGSNHVNGVNGHHPAESSGPYSTSKNGDIDETALERDVDRLMSEVDELRGLPGLYWGIWALIQAMISSIDFDYASYAEVRLGEYWAWKEGRAGSNSNGSADSELSLRERRWLQEED